MPATALDIAREAGVSHMTVSRVFSGRARVAEATRRRVLAVAERLEYRPDVMASALRGGQTRSVGVLWSLGSPTAEGIARKIALRLDRRGYVMFMAACLSDPQIIHDTLTRMAEYRVDGIILYANNHDLLKHPLVQPHFARFRAVVAIVPLIPPEEQDDLPVDLVVRRTDLAIHQIVDYWQATGRRHIQLACNPKSNQEKIDALRERLAHHGLPNDQAVIPLCDFQESVSAIDQYAQAYDRYFSDRPVGDAILGGSDESAAAVLMWLRRRGIAVPEQVAVCGFNNAELLRATEPPLAAMDWHPDGMADAITALLFERIEQESRSVQRVSVPMSFIWRASAGSVAPCATGQSA